MKFPGFDIKVGYIIRQADYYFHRISIYSGKFVNYFLEKRKWVIVERGRCMDKGKRGILTNYQFSLTS